VSSTVAVIVNFNSGSLLGPALDRLASQAVASTVVVDNASHDLSWQDALGRDGVKLHRLSTNQGFAAAVNFAVASTDEPYIFLLNADVAMGDGYVERLAGALDAEPRVAGATGTLTLPDGLIDSTGITLTTARCAFDRGRGAPADITLVDEPFGVSGAAALFRRDALLQVGGMWEELFVYWEDTEVAWRMRRAGWRFAHVPAARAVHARGSDSADPTFVEAADFGGRLAAIARNEGWPGLLSPGALFATFISGARLAVRHRAALRTSRPHDRIRAGLRARQADELPHVRPELASHPWRAWLTSQLTGSRRGLGALPASP
jgi:GT2 family glycosyltransferase